MPSEACLCAIRDSRFSGTCVGAVTNAVAKAATDPASACCCSPLAWLPRLKMPSISSGCAEHVLVEPPAISPMCSPTTGKVASTMGRFCSESMGGLASVCGGTAKCVTVAMHGLLT